MACFVQVVPPGGWKRRHSAAVRMADPPVSPFAPGGAANFLGKKTAMDEPKQRNRALEDWLSDHGMYMKDRSGWGKAPHGLVISNETTDEGEAIFEIPEDLCVTKKKAIDALGLDEDLNEYIAIAIFIISERNKGEESFWKPYFDVLPEDKDLNPMFRWTEEELFALKGSPALAACQSLQSKLRIEFDEVSTTVLDKNRTKFPEDVFTFEAWEWAFAVLFSRAILFNPLSPEFQELALVPYADLLNHNPYCSAFIERQSRMFKKKDKFVVLYCDRNYQKMEQVYTTYGQKSNAELAILYGFVVDRNPFDSIDVTVSLDKTDPLYETKKEYLERIGKQEAIEFPIYADRSPVEMIEFLRFCVANEEEMDIGVFNQQVSIRNELSVADALVNSCESALAGYDTTLDEDTKLMSDRKLYNMLGKNARMAVKLRRSEKRILTRTIADIERRKNTPNALFDQ